MSLVIGGSFESGCVSNPTFRRTSITAATPLARYSAVEGVLASGFATADLHHAVGHDRLAGKGRA
ncbi:MAG: hypothetical protein EOR84_00810 [Mesorhizobium sp.]|nr:MAG: hypothetical protein EOR84_00810 [Mesorhizobium sp.]